MTVNFTNILQAPFYYQSSLRTFYVLIIMFVIFWQKDFGAKAAHKTLVKLTPTVSQLIRKKRYLEPTCLLRTTFRCLKS